jgi:transposase-like protein
MVSSVKQQEMFAMVHEYETGRESLKKVANRHGIPTHRLIYWRRKYRNAGRAPSGGFIQLQPPSSPGLTLRYPNGVELTLTAMVSPTQLRELICLYPA